MAVISYSIENVVPEFTTTYSANVDRNSDERDPAVVALADGGFAVAYEWQDVVTTSFSILLDIYNSDGTPRFGTSTTFIDFFESDTTTADPSITQLEDGRILVTWTDASAAAPGIHFGTADPATGAILVSDTRLLGTDGADFVSDVWALPGGGWAMVKQDNLSATDQDADLIVYNSSGAVVVSRSLGNNSNFDEQKPAVTVLNNGNIVIAFEKETTNDTDTFSMAMEMYAPDGAPIITNSIFDGVGSQNRNPDIAALQDGGFVVVYEDNGVTANGASIAFFDAAGSLRGIERLDTYSALDRDLSVTVLPNGLVYVTFTDIFTGAGSENIVSALVDPVTMEVKFNLAGVEGQSGVQGESSVATLKNGTIVTAWTDNNSAIEDGNVDPDDAHVAIQIDRIVRTTASDETGETLAGDILVDRMFGNGGDDALSGGANNDFLEGGAGDDKLNGGTGIDTMTGGLDNDTYYVDNTGDIIVELPGEGTADKVVASVSYALASGVEVEFMQTSAVGGTNSINLYGNEFVQSITGNAGDNILNGKGGADTMRGLAGDDTYYVDEAGDIILEVAGQGTNDRVLASVSYALSATADIERMQTTSAAGTDAINLTGNKLAQTLIGNAGNNVLDGKGGADSMSGGAGDDTYYVDNAADIVDDKAGNGLDKVIASTTYALSATAEIEQMQTINASATNALNLTGNDFVQSMLGNAGNNRLDGKGGADTMNGLFGDDTYVVDNAGDVVIEAAGRGTADKVIASVSYALSANAEVEIMQTNGAALTTKIDLTGSNTDQAIFGNNGANRLDGKGGTDTLRGYGGPDTFVFSTKITSANVDTIVDFNVPQDVIELESDIFTGLTEGTFISKNQFAANTTGFATSADHRIVYETDTGNLYFDADGSGAGGRKLFGIVSTNLALTEDDFFVG